MFICLFVYWLVYFYFNNLGTPKGSYPENLWRSDLIWLGYLGSKNVYLFVCLLICLIFILIIMGHPQKVTLKILWRSDLIWLRYLGSRNVYLFGCLSIDLFLFYFNNLRTHTGSYPENFVKIWLDLAEIFRI